MPMTVSQFNVTQSFFFVRRIQYGDAGCQKSFPVRIIFTQQTDCFSDINIIQMFLCRIVDFIIADCHVSFPRTEQGWNSQRMGNRAEFNRQRGLLCNFDHIPDGLLGRGAFLINQAYKLAGCGDGMESGLIDVQIPFGILFLSGSTEKCTSGA